MSQQWFVIGHNGCRWALPRDAVRQVERSGTRYRVRLRELLLEVDELCGTVASLKVVPVGPIMGGLAPQGCCGMSIWGETPLVIVDPDSPPSVLYDASAETEHEGAKDGV